MPSWPLLLVGVVVVKAVLSLALKPGSFAGSYSGISYFLLLLLAAGLATYNAIKKTLGSRSFWAFLAIGCGLWALDEGVFLYYNLVRQVDVPDSSIADPVLFLHLVPLMAAVAILPHRGLSENKHYRTILNSLLLLFFWSFLYGYTVLPYEYVFANSTSYDLRFDILYLSENLALVLGLGIVALRAQNPWKSVYLHLLGASTLYALSSAVANLAIDSGGYVNGRLYGLGLTASVCWFVWIPLRARQLTEASATISESEDSQISKASVWAMLVVVMISIPMVWELFERDETTAARTIRLLVAIAAVVCLVSAVYIKEYLARRDLAAHVGLANDRLRMAMEAARSVGWDWDVKSGRDVWFGDLKTMFGIPSTSYVGRVEDFRRRVHPDDRGQVWKAVNDAMRGHQPYTAEFRVVWDDGTARWVAARGRFYYSPDGEAVRMLGMAVDVTDRKRMEEALRESEERLRLAAEAGRIYAYEWDVATDTVVRSPESVNILGKGEPTRTTRKQLFSTVHPHDRARVADAASQCTPQNPISRVIYRMVFADGSMIWVEKTARAFFDEQGKMLRVVGMVADVTERKRAEEALSSVNRRAIEAEEREHNRIARDLHEDIGQRLALLAIEIEQLNEAHGHTVELRSRMDSVWQQTLDILSDVKASAHELHSPRLEYLGIAEVLRCFCKEFAERKKVEIDFRSRGLPNLVPQDISICLFRVLQEALYNAVRHSRVHQFEVQLWGTAEEIHLTVGDSGAGFDVEAARTGQGLGLVRIEERLKLLQGTLSIESGPKHGTVLHACIPLSSESNSMPAAG